MAEPAARHKIEATDGWNDGTHKWRWSELVASKRQAALRRVHPRRCARGGVVPQRGGADGLHGSGRSRPGSGNCGGSTSPSPNTGATRSTARRRHLVEYL